MYQTFGISLTSQSFPVRNKKFLQLQVTSLRVLNELKYSTQYVTKPKIYLPQPENVFIERGDRFKLLHNTQLWIGFNNFGPLIDIENINEIIKKQTEIEKRNSRKIREIKETKINDIHIPKYVRIKLKASKQLKPLKSKKLLKKKPAVRTKPENDLRLQRKLSDEFVGEYYWPEKIYDINLNENIQELRQAFRKKTKTKQPLTIAKLLHPYKPQQQNINVTQNVKSITDIIHVDRYSQNSILNKIFNNTNDEQLKTNRYVDYFKRSPILFTSKEIVLNNTKPSFQINYSLDHSTLTQSAAQKIKTMINPYGTDPLRRLRIFNNNHYTYIYDKHLFDDILDTPPKIAYISPKKAEKRLQIMDSNAMKKERVFQYIRNNQNYLNMPTKSIHIQVNLPIMNKIVVQHQYTTENMNGMVSTEWNLHNMLNIFKIFVGKILKKKQNYFDKWFKRNHRLIDRIRSCIGLRSNKYIDLFPKLTNSDMSILRRKQKHNQENECHLHNIHPTRIINTRNDYVIQPSLDELLPFVDNQTCIVDNFTIERIGYGKIEFMEPIDVYNLNIDKYVQLTRKNIDIYPNDVDKPPIGVGLNQKAKITLYKVWPTEKYTNDTITDENQLESLHFQTMLKAISAERNFQFISYCGHTGCWVFCVDHF